MPAGRTEQRPVGLCRWQGRAAGLPVGVTVPESESPTFKLRTNQDLPRVGLATKQADRGAGIGGGHAGRPDPLRAAVCRAGYFTVTKKSASNKTETKTRCGRCVRGTSGIGRTLHGPGAWCRMS